MARLHLFGHNKHRFLCCMVNGFAYDKPAPQLLLEQLIIDAY